MPDALPQSQRTCAGCSKRDTPRGMLRVLFPLTQGVSPLALELPGGLGTGPRPPGRGAHVHARQECLERAVRKGFARAFRRQIRLSPNELSGLLKQRLETSLSRTLGAARRQKALRSIPTTDEPCLRLGAMDTSLAPLPPASKRVFAGTKKQLGALVKQPDAEEIAIVHPGLAARVQMICELASGAGIGGLEVG